MSERVRARVLLLIGDDAELTTEHRGADDPERVPVGRLITETGIPRARLVGADLVAVIGNGGELERFERVDGADGLH
ncbi:hypothetical protein [Streptomyces bicolor]|uniref:hypothetical protein n=1 Tax=Streptomyces bicolor TaxID=66874 RepID=UPI0004E26A4D|nr:hypothetical protein [Streptomyces bicolor]